MVNKSKYLSNAFLPWLKSKVFYPHTHIHTLMAALLQSNRQKHQCLAKGHMRRQGKPATFWLTALPLLLQKRVNGSDAPTPQMSKHCLWWKCWMFDVASLCKQLYQYIRSKFLLPFTVLWGANLKISWLNLRQRFTELIYPVWSTFDG